MNFESLYYFLGIKSIEKQFEIAAQYRASIRPTACGARAKPARMWWHGSLTHDLAATQPGRLKRGAERAHRLWSLHVGHAREGGLP
jgi:hypothetical protein